tara:strand:+ start:86604 stop:86783 length:180 start_codon:yes stop_codon:yes gene_type:complete
MKPIAVVMALLALAACGADGEPVQPTGTAQVTMSSSGVHLGSTIGARRGPFALTLGLGL